MSRAADLMVRGARLWSGAVLRDADGIAVAEGRVQAIGSAAELDSLRSRATRVLDARGATVTPGLTDAHIHLVAWARTRGELDLSGARSRSEALARVVRALAALPAGRAGAVIGRGWDANSWDEPPDRAALDAVAGDRPVLLHSKDAHTLWVNGAALRAAGIGRDRPDPPGGRIERDRGGEPTGLVREHAATLCAGLETHTPESDLEWVRSAVPELHACGVTAVHDFEGADAQRTLRALARASRPRLRILMHLAHAGLDHALAVGLESGIGDDGFRIGAVKLFADGTLGSRTAAMLSPYDGTADVGMELLAPDQLEDAVRRALSGGLSVAIHAIGDRACRSSLDAFEAARSSIARVALPPRLEHVQLLDPSDLPRFAALGVAASMQPTHCASDIELAERYWGSRKRHSYPWRGLLDAGALLAFGSDAPVESPSVALGLHAAVTRERPGRAGAYVPEQRIGLDAALTAYTEGASRLAGHWPRLGCLKPGATADLVVWNEDLHRLDPAELWRAHPVATIVEGEVVYDRGAGSAPPREVGIPSDHSSVAGGGEGR